MRRSDWPAILLLLGILIAPAAFASFDNFDFSGDITEQRFQNVVSKLRCLVCQNESLAGSQAELAQDLRREVYNLMKSGKDDKEVIDFLVNRYGDFVLYQPPLKSSTWLLWLTPFILLVTAALLLGRTLRKRSHLQESGLTPEQQEKVRKLLSDSSSDSGNSP